MEVEAELVTRVDGGQDPPDAQRDVSARWLTVAEVKGSHTVYVSQPQAVATTITKAAHDVAFATR